MNFLSSIFASKGAKKEVKTNLKLTPEVLAVKARIEARRKKEEQAAREQNKIDQFYIGNQNHLSKPLHHSITVQEEIRILEKRAGYAHNDRLTADSEIFANSRMDVWQNSIALEDPPETIMPDFEFPEAIVVTAKATEHSSEKV